jgi:hypothetical protein
MNIVKKPDSRPKPRVREHGTVLFPKPNEAIIGFDEEGVVAFPHPTISL